jgi:MerR family transcriptional regulator/heat shock protein HspR
MERSRKKGKAAYMISAVAESYGIHPQTLRLYEREGLLKPSRSEGNTRLYTEEDLERLELILSLTRDLGVNLAGVEVILNMRRRMEEMQKELQEFIEYIEREFANRSPELDQKIQHALVRVTPPHVVLAKSEKKTDRSL